MFALNLSQDGVNFKSYFQNGRLRKYDTIPKAINASKQLMNNEKNNLHTVVIYSASTNEKVVWVMRDTKGVPFVDSYGGDRELSTGEETINNKEDISNSIEKDYKKIPIEDLIITPKESISDNKIVNNCFWEDSYKKHQEKKENLEDIKEGSCINNLSNPSTSKDLINIPTNKDGISFPLFMSVLVKHAIDHSDYKVLFYAEKKLAQKGYSWYPDAEGNIKVDRTKEVINILKKLCNN